MITDSNNDASEPAANSPQPGQRGGAGNPPRTAPAGYCVKCMAVFLGGIGDCPMCGDAMREMNLEEQPQSSPLSEWIDELRRNRPEALR